MAGRCEYSNRPRLTASRCICLRLQVVCDSDDVRCTGIHCPGSEAVENVATVQLPLKAARRDRRDAIANFKCVWSPAHEQPNFDLFMTFAVRRDLIRLASAIYLRFGKV